MKLRPPPAVASALVARSSIGLVGEVRGLSLAPSVPRLSRDRWRLDSRNRRRVERCLRAAPPSLPEDSLTALEAPALENGYLSWVQTLLPERQIMLGVDDPEWRASRTVLSYGGRSRDRRLGDTAACCGWLYEAVRGFGSRPSASRRGAGGAGPGTACSAALARRPGLISTAPAASLVALHTRPAGDVAARPGMALAGGPLLGAVGWLWSLRAPPAGPRGRVGFGWGDVAAIAACLLIGGLAVTMAIDNPDFVFHWGLKARKFALAGGLDFRFLQNPSNWRVHPDYPNLLPEVFALTALGEGSLREPPLLAWSGLFFGASLLAAREALARRAADAVRREATLAFVGFSVAVSLIATDMTGHAAPLIAWALLLAPPALVDPQAPGPVSGWRLPRRSPHRPRSRERLPAHAGCVPARRLVLENCAVEAGRCVAPPPPFRPRWWLLLVGDQSAPRALSPHQLGPFCLD